MAKNFSVDLSSIWEQVQERLQEKGIDLDFPSGFDFCSPDGEGGRIKVVCVAPDLRASVDELGQTPREHVVMVRVDDATRKDLDDWVATGAVRSRSEAAALFIKEGLRMRADELERLRDALSELEQAQEKLREQAREIFGEGTRTADRPSP